MQVVGEFSTPNTEWVTGKPRPTEVSLQLVRWVSFDEFVNNWDPLGLASIVVWCQRAEIDAECLHDAVHLQPAMQPAEQVRREWGYLKRLDADVGIDRIC